MMLGILIKKICVAVSGLYIREDNMDVPERYRGIGIRIEDDVLITESGPVVMSAMLPKDPDEIEAIMADR